MSDRPARRAVVVGASIAGLLAGRVLSDFFDEVILIDKENLNAGTNARRAVPQGNHVHMILTPTYLAIQSLLPGLVDDLVSHGATVFDAGLDARLLIAGKPLIVGETGQPIIGSTRPFFEHFLRKRVSRVENLQIRSGHRFLEWVQDPDQGQVSGVVTSGPEGMATTFADLFVDARGRASTIATDLRQMGFAAPDTDVVGINLSYTSRLYRVTGQQPKWNLLFVPAFAPSDNKGAVIAKIENDEWLVTQFGYFGNSAPASDDGFLGFADNLDAPDVSLFLQKAVSVSDYQIFGVRSCEIKRLERLDRYPDRLLAIGDTVCNLNPVYGQGMTKAAKEALFLSELLTEHFKTKEALDGFTTQFRRNLPDAGANWGWKLTSGVDLEFPDATGNRSAIDSIMVAYVKRLLIRASTDLDARRRVLNAAMLVESPTSLLKPRMLLHAIGI
jgi:2-polyprenyl-6-methoxyphenol hydroxylase-like FAD-dependent oxidoreductase